MVNNKKKRNKKKKEKKNEQKVALPLIANASFATAIANRPKNKDNSNNIETPVCLHGCSADKVSDSEYSGILDDWKTVIQADADHIADMQNEFYIKHNRSLLDPEFARYVFALATEHYLHNGLNDEYKGSCMHYLILLGIKLRYDLVPMFLKMDTSHGSELHEKYNKYGRDLKTDRGIINCLARETPCSCMDEAKKRAALMKKHDLCDCCEKEFPKKEMFYCICKFSTYCGKDCQLKDWPRHKSFCKKFTENVNP